MTLKAVFFDMGGTIETFSFTDMIRLERTPGIHSLLLSAGINLGLNNQQLFEVVTSGLKDYHNWSLTSLIEFQSEKVWTDFIFKDYSIDLPAISLIAEDLMFYIETQFYKREMRPEIPEVLEKIKKLGLKIGLISNVNSRGQVPFNLKEYKINQYFDPIVLSSEYGRRKPDPSIFHYAARLADVPTSACIYVGDRISRDIDGSRRAGYRLSVQIQHDFDHGELDSGPEPDMKIENMNELMDIVQLELTSLVPSIKTDERSESCLQALLFDAGDILYFRPDRNNKLNEFLKELSLNEDAASSEAGRSLKKKAFHGEINRDQYQEALLHLYGITSPELINQGKQILDYENNNISFFEGVRDTLIELKERGFLLGIITDTAASIDIKMKWFETGGFGHVWDTFISSMELGFQKPDPRIYHAALKQLGVRPNHAVFVGHDRVELAGASNVGIKTIAFNYKEDAKADFYINEFSDLLRLTLLERKL